MTNEPSITIECRYGVVPLPKLTYAHSFECIGWKWQWVCVCEQTGLRITKGPYFTKRGAIRDTEMERGML